MVRQNPPWSEEPLRIREWVCPLLVASGLLIVPALRGRLNTVDLSGLVLDPQRTAVPDAKVTAENLATADPRQFQFALRVDW